MSEACQERLGCLLFSASAAWALAPRDAWIGWRESHRKKLLALILRNDRFLIFPWVEVPHLASHALSLATRQIADDWLESFGYWPVLIETFVDPTYFTGICYRAANWQCLGHTQGRGRLAPDHERRLSQKQIFVYPLQSDWRQHSTRVPRAAELKQRDRSGRKASRTQTIDVSFVALWEHVVHIFRDVAGEYDRQWRVRKRVVDTLMLMLLIFRLVCSKNTQSYGTTIDEFWDHCRQLQWPLPQKASLAPSSFCTARRKLDEAVFKCAHQKILAAYADAAERYTWRGHRLFAIDGSKINLPRALLACGYSTPTPGAHYPQGLVSCLYQIKSRLPFDFDLVAHADERRCALDRLNVLEPDDVVVYDRGYFSYRLLLQHIETGVHAIFRLHDGSAGAVAGFMAGSQTEAKVTVNPSSKARTERGVKQELFAHFVLITLSRLFTNRTDLEINPLQPSASAPDEAAPQRKTNFENAIHVLERGLEELLLLHEKMKGVVQPVFLTIFGRHQRVRPNRSFARRSMRPHTKWTLTKEKRQARKAATATVA